MHLNLTKQSKIIIAAVLAVIIAIDLRLQKVY
jgi:hypothetical protein